MRPPVDPGLAVAPTGRAVYGHPCRRYASGGISKRGGAMGVYDLKMTSISGEAVDLAQFRGQVCLVVNVASR
jgi:hypothetical protein